MIQREKRYVEVDVRFSTEGRLRPLQIIFDKGQVYKIDKIKDIIKHDTPLLFTPSGANHEQGLGQARPNKITSEMQTHCRSEVPVEHNIFKN